MEREVSESVDHAHVAADHTRTATGRDGDGSPSGVVESRQTRGQIDAAEIELSEVKILKLGG